MVKVRELIEKTKERPLAEIARDELTVGEKTARRALSYVGGRTVVGERGWIADRIHPHDMERSIYGVVQEVKNMEKEYQRQAANRKDESDEVVRKRHSFDLDVRLMKELKIYCVANDVTLYEAVEESVRDYLKKHRDGEGIDE